MLNGQGLVAQAAVLQGDGALVGVALVLTEQDVVVKQVGPIAGGGIIVGIRVIGQEVGEGLAFLQLGAALHQGVHLLAQLPELHGGGAVGLVLGSDQHFHPAVVVQVGDGIAPVVRAFLLDGGQGLQQGLHQGVGRLLSGLGVRRGGGGCWLGGGLAVAAGRGSLRGDCGGLGLLGRNAAAGGEGEGQRQDQDHA